jgi:3-hydroxyisobutyrate dehydrogenase-like beta-hydroxyacid dehydrogenase
MKVGWIGLGNMGMVMAPRLVAAGHELIVYNRTHDKARALVESGARLAETPAGVAEAELVVTMLSDDQALRDVVGPGGLLSALRPGAVHVSMSTISPALARELAASHAARGVGFVGAPVFGRPDAAAAGRLFIVVGGEPHALAPCEPIFAALSQKVLPMGTDPAAAHLTKVLGNFMLISSVELLAEALNVAHSSGVEPEALLNALTGSVFSAPFYAGYGRLLVAQRFDGPAAFTVPLARKDVSLAIDAAGEAGAPLPLARTVRDKLERVLAEGGADLDLTAIGKWTQA